MSCLRENPITSCGSNTSMPIQVCHQQQIMSYVPTTMPLQMQLHQPPMNYLPDNSNEIIYVTQPHVDSSSSHSEGFSDNTSLTSSNDIAMLMSMITIVSESLSELHKKVDVLIAAKSNAQTMTASTESEEIFHPVNTFDEITALNEKLKSEPEYYSKLVSGCFFLHGKIYVCKTFVQCTYYIFPF